MLLTVATSSAVVLESVGRPLAIAQRLDDFAPQSLRPLFTSEEQIEPQLPLLEMAFWRCTFDVLEAVLHELPQHSSEPRHAEAS